MKITLTGGMSFRGHCFLRSIMRTFIFLCCSISFALSSNKGLSQNADILIEKERTLNVKQAFKLINKQTDFKFIYRSDLLKNAPEQTVEKGIIKARTLLDKFLLPINFTYTFTENNTIIVKRIPPPVVKTNEDVQYQISGTVVDGAGVALSGASIIEKETTNGTQADFDGNFSITVSSTDAILVISYIGFKSQEIVVGDQTQINAVLQEDSAQLDEVIVVGYGTQKREDVSSAITSVSGEAVNVTKESNPLLALAGKAAGVDIRFSTNAPGTSPEILIRGRSSLSLSNEPLVVVDGIPVETSLADFNPNDIESFQILKDASSAAIYGARGANGVILITTKRGKPGRPQITYDGYYGFSEPFEKVPLLNSEQWTQLRIEAQRTVNERSGGSFPTIDDGNTLTEQQLEAFNAGVDNDWQDLMFQSGVQQNHQIGVSGGSESARYNVSLNYFEQGGIIKGSGFERVTNRVNLDIDVTDKLSVGLSQQIAFSDRDDVRSGSTLGRIFSNLPVFRAFEEDGSLTTNPLNDSFGWNPLQDLVPGNLIDNERFFNYFANIFASYNLTNNLSYRVNIGPQYQSLRANEFRGTLSTRRRGGVNEARKFNRAITSLTIENIVNYNKTFNEVHNLDGTFLFSSQDIRNEENSIDVRNLPSETQTYNNLGAAEEITGTSSSLNTERFSSLMARLRYGYKSKYLLTLTGRYDGSSKLAPGNKWQFFPSGDFKWVISREDFLADSKTVNNLGLRVGYGTVGRSGIDAFTSQGSLSRTEGSFGDNPAFGFRPNEIANPELTWEIKTEVNLGLDFGLFNNRISGSVDYYQGNTTDLLLDDNLPDTSGFDDIERNIGETENSGFEVILNTVNVQTEDFTWSTSVNFSKNTSKIKALADGVLQDVGDSRFVGEQINVYFDRVFDGIWQLDEADEAASFGREVGQIKLRDLNDDGEINDDDRQIVGFRDPQWIGGLSTTFQYKGWDFSVGALTRQGHTIRARAIFANNSLVGRNNNVDINYWTPENPSNQYPRPDADRQGPRDESASNYFDGSYIRIRNITLGYDFNRSVLETIGMQRLRFYATAQNPFLFRSDDRLVDGVDPDVAESDDEWFPSPRTILFGLTATF